ncbi:MAG: PA14 domain-containing protein [Thermoplasmatota archaeon]
MVSCRGSKHSESGLLFSAFAVVILVLVSFAAVDNPWTAVSLPTGNIVVEYNFDDGSGQTVDDTSGNGWDGQLGETKDPESTDPSWSTGISGGCIEFDGSDDYLITNPMDFPTSEFTFAFWIRSSEDQHNQFPLSYAVEGEDNEVLFGMKPNIYVEVDYPENVETDIDIRDGTWHHVAVAWRNTDGDIRIYIDGEEEFAGSLAEGVEIIQGGALVLGHEQDEVGGGFELHQGLVGSMDHFVLLDKYLSASEVKEHYGEFMLPIGNISVLEGNGFVDLSWKGTSDPDIVNYNIYRLDPDDIQNGLAGDYFNNMNLTDLVLSRLDETIDFGWGYDSPDGSIDSDTFSARWDGFIRIEYDGFYTFKTENDDGIRLWIDGRNLIDEWYDGIQQHEVDIRLKRGYHPIRIEFYDNTQGAKVHLRWRSDRIVSSIIPAENLLSLDESAFTRIGTVKGTNFRDTGLENDETYFYYITYETGSGESGRSDLIGAVPSYPSSLSLFPIKMTATVGSTVSFDILVKNEGASLDWFNLNITGIDESWYSLSDERFTLSTGQYNIVYLDVTVPGDAEAGTVTFTVDLSTEVNPTNKHTGGWLEIITDPIIRDLRPHDKSQTGSTDVLFSWRTDVEASTELFLRKEGDPEFERYIAGAGMNHLINISGLHRETTYEFHVRSTSARGSAESEERSFFIDNGVIFASHSMAFHIDRDYDQRKNVQIKNTDNRVHFVKTEIDGDYDDFIFNFIGEGSEDDYMAVPPGETRTLVIAFHAQDAMRREYDLTLNLSTLPDWGAFPLTDTAHVKVRLNHLFVNMTIEEIASDPYTLEKTLRITNLDDKVTDVRIFPEDRLIEALTFDPIVSHGKMESGETMDIKVAPELMYAFGGFSGKVFLSAYDKLYSIDLDFSPRPGWEVFAASVYPNWGGIPYKDIDPDDLDIDGLSNIEDPDMDGDGILNIDEPGFSMDTDNDGYPNMIDGDDDGDGNPDPSDFWRIDFDNDWLPNYLDPDRDGDGINNTDDDYPDDHDNDLIINGRDPDDDNDKIPDDKDYHPTDHDNDGEDDSEDSDDDDDGQDDSSSDPFPYDNDNDGTPDAEDSDWKGGGNPNWKSNKWNPNPSPGGSPGGWGGGGGSDSSGGDDWYCTNKPELDLIDLIVDIWGFLSNALTAVGIVASLCTPGGLAAAIGAAAMWAAQQAASYWATGMSFSDLTKYHAHNFNDYVNSRSIERGIMGRILRDDVAKYYPNYQENISWMPRMLISSSGIHFYWHETVDGNTEIQYARSSEFSPKLDKITQLTDAPGDSLWPTMDAGPDGELAMAWIDYRDGDGEIYFKYSRNGGSSWTDDIRVTNAAGDVDDPVVKIDEFGRVHLAWTDERDGNPEIYYIQTDDGGETWQREARISDTLSASTHPYMEYGGDNYIHVVYTDNESGHGEIYHSSSDDRGFSWDPSEQISDSGVDAGESSLAVSENGSVHVVWRDSKHGDSEIFYLRGEDQASSWDDPVRVTDDDSYSEYPHVSCAGNTVMMDWHDDRTGLDLNYFKFSQDDGLTFSKEKRAAAGHKVLDRVTLEIEFKPREGDDVKPHTVHILVNDKEIGVIEDTVPDGLYTFDIPLNVLNLADSMIHTNNLKIITEHLNDGHYVVLTNWKINYHYLSTFEFVCAPDQYTADEYVRGNIADNRTLEDPAVYANRISLSDPKPDLGEKIVITAEISNPGGEVAADVEVRFYEQEPFNASRQIGETLSIDGIAPFGSEILTVNWTAGANVTRLYCTVDDKNAIVEGSEENNIAYVPVVVVFDTPPKGEVIIAGGTDRVRSASVFVGFDLDSLNEVTHVQFSNDNSTWSEWERIYEFMNWNLDQPSTRSYAPLDGIRTVYVRFKDIAGLESEVHSDSVEVFLENPVILWSNVDDGNLSINESLRFEFSNPMEDLSVRTGFNITPEMDGSFTWDDRFLYYHPVVNWTEGVTYNVTFAPGIKDIWDRGMTKSISFNFTATRGIPGGGDDDDDDTNETDTDGDGIPDWWEDLYGLNKTDPSDAGMDLDNDTYSNLDEFLGNTDPTDPDDRPGSTDGGGGSGNSWWIIACVSLLVILTILIIAIFVIVRMAKGGSDEEEDTDWEE